MINELNRLNDYLNTLHENGSIDDQKEKNQELDTNIKKLHEQNLILKEDIEE